MKNIFRLIFSCILILTLAACSKPEDRTVIKFSRWGSESEISILKPILKEFEQQNPDIKVNFVHIPKNYFQKLHLLIASNLAPDVIFLNNLNGPVYAENGVLEDLNPYISKDKDISEKEFFQNSLQAFNYDNKLYAVPRDVSNLVVYYNKDLFDRNNIAYPNKNWTFEDFLLSAKALTKDYDNNGRIDCFGSSFEKNPLFWQPFLWSNGGGIISTDLKTAIVNKPESVEALQFYADLRNKLHVAPTASEQGSATMSQMFMQGKIAMQISGRWNVPRYRRDIEFNWDIARFPSGKIGSIVDADASGWAISKSSTYKEQAWRLIKFLASKNSCEKFSKGGLIVPARVDVANSDTFLSLNLKPYNSRVFIDIIPESIPTPANKNYQEIIDIINNSFEPLWNGHKTAKDVANEDLNSKIQKLLK